MKKVLLALLSCLVPACLGSDPGVIGTSSSACDSSSSGTSSGGGNATCGTPKQIRLLDEVAVYNKPIEIRYDALDRNEPLSGDMKLPKTELVIGDVVEIDPLDPLHKEKVLVKDVDVILDQSGAPKYYRTFTAEFQEPHIVHAPGTTPIEDGCPAFVMPMQDVCDEHGEAKEIQSSCFMRVCMYGEWVLYTKPEFSPCGYTLDGETYYKGKCLSDGACLP